MPKYTSEDLLQSVQEILPLIAQQAPQAEKIGHLTDTLLNQLFDLGVFKLFVTEKYHGHSCDLPTALKIFELMSSADGATGWLVMIGAGGGLFSGFIEESAAREIFSPKRAVIAGSGMASGFAKTQAGGYEVSGRWPYASGAYHASWFTANCKIDGDDAQIRSIAVPAKHVEIHQTWDVFGMKATGSHDFSIKPRLIESRFAFSLFENPILDEPIFYCPLDTLASLTFTSVAIGIARHALSEFKDFAESRKRLPNDASLQALQQAEELIHNAKEELYRLADDVWQRALLGLHPDKKLHQQVDTNCITIVQDSVKAVDLLKARAGMMAVKNNSTFGRAWRDLHTLSQHVIISPKETHRLFR